MNARLLFEDAGPMTTVQDLGRFGAQALGVPPAGALDRIGLRVANALAGNAPGEAGLELRLKGPTVRVVGGTVRIALAGTSTPLNILGPNRRTFAAGRSVTLHHGDVFRIGSIADTSCCYLAIAGGIALAPVLESRSTYSPARIGGVEGRALRDGDTLAPREPRWDGDGDVFLPHPFHHNADTPIRVVLGPQDDYFAPDAIETFLRAEYRVSNALNRMGVRLLGPALSHSRGFNIASDGIVTGSIQVPGSGLPIILLSDRQTTGGYPKIGTVISADVPRFARLMPDRILRFRAVSVAEAQALRQAQEQAIETYLGTIRACRTDSETLCRRLMHDNLISGVHLAGDRTG